MSNLKNKTKRRAWPPKRRAEQAKRIRKQKPWKHTTGPKTPEGKQAVRANARVHGLRSAEMAEIRRRLREQKAFVRAVLARIPRH